MDEVKRYEFTYANSFNDKYSADRELDPDGEYVLHTDYAKLSAERDALQAECERLRAFVESIVNALGPYPEVNGTQLVMDAYRALAKPTGGTEL